MFKTTDSSKRKGDVSLKTINYSIFRYVIKRLKGFNMSEGDNSAITGNYYILGKAHRSVRYIDADSSKPSLKM